MPRTNKKFLIRYLLLFLVQIWRLELSTRDNMRLIETVQPVTTKLEILDTKITQTNSMEFL